MAKTFLQPGEYLTVTAPAGGVSSGDPVLIGSLFGIALTDAAAGASVELATTGVWSVPKVSAQAWSAGAAIYFDDSAGKATTVSTDNTFIGIATAAAANPTSTGTVKLVHAAGTAAVATVVALQLDIADLDETTPAYAVAPIDGTVTAVRLVVGADATGSAAVAAETVVTPSIGGTPITDGAVTITGSAAIGTAFAATPTAANTVSAGDVISVASDGADTADHPATIVLRIAG